MREKSEHLKQQIKAFCEDFYLENQAAPSLSVIGNALKKDKSTISRYLRQMNDDGMISYDSARGVVPECAKKVSNDALLCFVLGSVSCGEAFCDEENVERVVSLPTEIFGHDRLFALHANGDSMEDVGIFDGDLVFIEKTCFARPGDIIVALCDNHETTLKTLMGKSKKTGNAVLRYENRAVYGEKTIEVSDLKIQGVLKWCLKGY